MKTSLFLSWLVLIGSLTACGGGPDFDYACEQVRACFLPQGGTPAVSQDQCVEDAETLYNNAPDYYKKVTDAHWDTCKDEKSCEFTACFDYA